jgi:hypothetical protein
MAIIARNRLRYWRFLARHRAAYRLNSLSAAIKQAAETKVGEASNSTPH